jgi:tubulin delta
MHGGIVRQRSSSVADRCLANLLVLRGKSVSEADVSLFDDKALYPIWSVNPLSVATSIANFGEYDMFVGMLSNAYSAVVPVSHGLSKAVNMYSSRAFLHHYFRHGLEQDAFETSLATAEEIVAHYSAL